MKHSKKIAALIVLLPFVWFASVDRSWFVEDCPDCEFGRDIVQYRILTIPVREEIDEYRPVVQRIAEDLGVPCRHQNSSRRHKHRWWGLLICKSPCLNGTYRITSDDAWYDQEASAKIAELMNRDESIREEFVQTVLRKHDYTFVRTILTRAGINPSQ